MTEFKIGDIITTYHKGYWRLVEIQQRYYNPEKKEYSTKRKKGFVEYSPIFIYDQILTASFEKPKNKIPIRKECDARWCHKLTPELIEAMIKDIQKKAEILKSLLEQ